MTKNIFIFLHFKYTQIFFKLEMFYDSVDPIENNIMEECIT
jgi:hypothetical protein